MCSTFTISQYTRIKCRRKQEEGINFSSIENFGMNSLLGHKMQQHPSPHAAFFSSLKWLEKRLASENNNNLNNKTPSENPLSLSATTSSSAKESQISAIYLNYHQSQDSSNSSQRLLQDSDPPPEFLSHSVDFPPTAKDPPQTDISNHDPKAGTDSGDEIERLISLLGLSNCTHEGGSHLKSTSCFSRSGFYSKIAGVKGPKCEKEMERIDGWIECLGNDGDGGRKEPLRLAHLLLGKAACLNENGFGGIEFPATVEDYLDNDPPAAQHG